jgi:hypothetical protein
MLMLVAVEKGYKSGNEAHNHTHLSLSFDSCLSFGTSVFDNSRITLFYIIYTL